MPPVPPAELLIRIGVSEGADPVEDYQREGAALRERIERMLPAEWNFEGKRILDFGCGSGRVLSRFLDEATSAEFWGCDIDGASIDWLSANLSPPLHFFQNQPAPPLAVPDGHIDLVWAMSVFTHIDRWSDWLLEMHRILRPDGLLIASWLGEGMWEALLGEPYHENEVGVTVLRHWEVGGALVFHSEWWLRAHWGRAFEVLAVERPARNPSGGPDLTHSYIVLRRRDGRFTRAELEQCRAEEPRELAALQTSLRLLRQELDGLLRGDIALPTAGTPPRASSPSVIRRAIHHTPLASPLRKLRARLRPAP